MPFADELLNAATAEAPILAVEAADPGRGALPSLRAAASRAGPGQRPPPARAQRPAPRRLLADLPGDHATLGATVRRAAAGPHRS